ncbi:MAG: glycerol-3-phosphate 1-O-acyltransferase PlsB [Pseudomonadota bacterium]|nr:glycerol-3-phosphate 1-O-acyltransferase PlsB [Pseudomonadota bacterium]
MSVINKLRAKVNQWQQKLLYKVVKTKIIGADTAQMQIDESKPVIYAMLYPSYAEQIVINKEVSKLGWQSPFRQRLNGTLSGSPYFGIYRRPSNPFRKDGLATIPRHLRKQAEWMLADDERDIQVLPVRVMWGRSPERERSFLRIWLQNGGTLGGRLMTMFAILFNGRNTFVHFSEPLSLRELAGKETSSELVARKLARVLRVHNRKVTRSVLGPDLSHRRTLVHQIPNRPMVRTAIEKEMAENGLKRDKLRKRAKKYADEIASNISYTNVRFLDILLTWVWNKIYNGTAVHNIDQVKEISKDNTIVYVPCHRSHIDYLLLSYVLYHQGLQLPQIAAGINLNMPVVGSILRRGGAFFMRRTFRGNPLYAAVFDEYLHSVFTHGYSSEYFVEGGRSRTGRTLSPKAGMLAMTVRSYLRDSRKPLTFVPVYTGYEKVFEEKSYLGELRGKAKKKESLLDVLGTLRSFKKSFGKVNVTFGEPVHLTPYLDERHPGWSEQDYEDCNYRPDWAPELVDELANTVVTEINRAASVNPINLIALAILASPRQALDEKQLIRQMEAYRDLLAMVPYSDMTVLPEGHGKEWLAHAEELDSVSRSKHDMGDLIQTNERQAVTLTYYRNNILHIIALPSLIACLLLNNRRCSLEEIQESCKALYPFLQAELFLHWSQDTLNTAVQNWLSVLEQRGYVELEDDHYHCCTDGDNLPMLQSLADPISQTLQRYFLAVSRLKHQGSGNLTAQQLEEQSTLLAQRLSLLYGINAPEFFDKALFRALIRKLIETGMISCGKDDTLSFDDDLNPLTAILESLLDANLRQTILSSL